MSNIKLTNSVKIAAESLAVTIDTSNLLASASVTNTSKTYTATQDCYFIGVGPYMGWDSNTPTLNDVSIASFGINQPWGGYLPILLKKRDKFWMWGNGGAISVGYKVFGLK